MKFRACIAVGADRNVVSTDGSVPWLDSFQAEHSYNDFIQEIDAIVLGRTTLIRPLGLVTGFFRHGHLCHHIPLHVGPASPDRCLTGRHGKAH